MGNFLFLKPIISFLKKSVINNTINIFNHNKILKIKIRKKHIIHILNVK